MLDWILKTKILLLDNLVQMTNLKLVY